MKEMEIPDGDILIHAGDLTSMGTLKEIKTELNYLDEKVSNFREVILVAGNHDWLAQSNPSLFREVVKEYGFTYLQDSGVTIDGVNFYGSPWQPRFFDWAFNQNRGADIKRFWDLIPDNTDVLITHGPPYGIGDPDTKKFPVGCKDLLEAIRRVKPKLHICGHLHEGYGVREVFDTKFINCAVLDDYYNFANNPIVVDL
jgi:Icc-related predicted phosphoesterase